MKLSRRIFSTFLAVVLLFGIVPVAALAKGPIMYGIGFTTGSDLRLRKEASTTSGILDVAPKGEVVVVIEQVGEWYHVVYNLQEGYMHKDYVDVKTSRNAELGYGSINANEVNMRTGPGTGYRSVQIGYKGDNAYIIGINSGWYKVICKDNICYIRSDYVDLTEIPYENADSNNSPLFFENGSSTGIQPSAAALRGASGSEKPVEEPEDTKPQETEPKETEPKETEPQETKPTDKQESTPSKDDGLVDGIGFITASALNLRKDASTASPSITSGYRGEVVVILDKVGDWYKVNYNLRQGYMHSDYLKVSDPGHAELGYGKITGNGVNLRTGPSTSHQSVAIGYKGSTAYIVGVEDGWYRVIFGNHVCYIRSDYLSLTQVPYENRASSNSPKFYEGGVSTGIEPSAAALKGSTDTTGGGNESTAVTGAKIVATANKYLGTPYRWGGASPSGFDCSGFVYYVLKNLGMNPPRMQVDMYKMGSYVPKEELKPGDIVFFQNTYKAGLSHVGIYVGNGQFIHSPNSGSVVSYADLNSTYWTNHYYGARRVANG